MNFIEIGDSQCYIKSSTLIDTLKKELIKRIQYKSTFADLFIRSSDSGDILCKIVDKYHGQPDYDFITDDQKIIDLYESIVKLNKVL